MAASVHLDAGNGPLVVLLHGVGLGPRSFGPLVERLVDDHRVVVVERPVGGAVEAQADAVAHVLRSVGGPACFVGVSGGATIGLALAMRHGEVASSWLLHEPLVGRLAPGLHERFVASAQRAASSDDEAVAVVRAVMGERTWSSLDDEARAEVVAGASRWRLEIGAFAAFEPSARQLRRLAPVALVASVGAESDPDRRACAAVLHDLVGAEVALVPGAGNAAHLDAPDALATLVRSRTLAPVGDPA